MGRIADGVVNSLQSTRMEAGAQYGHDTVLAAIGKGGMGGVWKARDTKLGREVAIKTLPPEFAQS